MAADDKSEFQEPQKIKNSISDSVNDDKQTVLADSSKHCNQVTNKTLPKQDTSNEETSQVTSPPIDPAVQAQLAGTRNISLL